MHAYEVRPRKDNRGVNLISDALPFGRPWYVEPNAIALRRGIDIREAEVGCEWAYIYDRNVGVMSSVS
jgi:hypothetical protein